MAQLTIKSGERGRADHIIALLDCFAINPLINGEEQWWHPALIPFMISQTLVNIREIWSRQNNVPPPTPSCCSLRYLIAMPLCSTTQSVQWKMSQFWRKSVSGCRKILRDFLVLSKCSGQAEYTGTKPNNSTRTRAQQDTEGWTGYRMGFDWLMDSILCTAGTNPVIWFNINYCWLIRVVSGNNGRISGLRAVN